MVVSAYGELYPESQLTIRIIPRLDIKGPNLVKGVHLEGLRILGKPERFARYYYENGADELIYQDAVASLYGRNSLLAIIEQTSREIFIPLTVGGGLRSIDDIRAVLRAGADKVSLNTAAIARPELIREASRKFGSSTIVISIEAKKQANGRYECYTDGGREKTGVDVIEWAKRVEDLGAGEILLTSIDQEGTGKGFAIELVKEVSTLVSIPVIACGGAGSLQHIVDVVSMGKADAVSAASIFHYRILEEFRNHDADYSSEGNIEFLSGRRSFGRDFGATIKEAKAALLTSGFACRDEEAHVSA